jgi:hypothetical protein
VTSVNRIDLRADPRPRPTRGGAPLSYANSRVDRISAQPSPAGIYETHSRARSVESRGLPASQQHAFLALTAAPIAPGGRCRRLARAPENPRDHGRTRRLARIARRGITRCLRAAIEGRGAPLLRRSVAGVPGLRRMEPRIRLQCDWGGWCVSVVAVVLGQGGGAGSSARCQPPQRGFWSLVSVTMGPDRCDG